jgi:hypothetical protein
MTHETNDINGQVDAARESLRTHDALRVEQIGDQFELGADEHGRSVEWGGARSVWADLDLRHHRPDGSHDPEGDTRAFATLSTLRVPLRASDVTSFDVAGQALLADWCEAVQAV